MPRKHILISGAGIAGPTLAFWLLKRGFQPVIVERALNCRAGGFMIDFWGVGYDVAEQMGLIPVLRQLSYGYDRIAFLRQYGGIRSTFGGHALRRALGDRFLSIQRATLANVIYDTIREKVETIFGDEIIQLTPNKEYVEVRFKSGVTRSFDLIIGAEGLHSAIREFIFDRKAVTNHYLGYYAAAFVTHGYSKRGDQTYWSYAAPGRQISRFALRGNRTGFLMVFSNEQPDPEFARELSEQKQTLYDVFSRDPWIEWPEIKAHLAVCQDLYFDAVSQIELPKWFSGRTALVGDAAYCPSLLAGEGSALAMAGAYILAGELERAAGRHACAFPAYERQFRPFMERKQRSARAFASSFTPKTSTGLLARDLVLHLAKIPIVAKLLTGRFLMDRYSLPHY